MSAGCLRLLIIAHALVLLAACGRAEPGRPVRTPAEAAEVARQALKSAHLDEQVVGVEQQDGAWIVTTRWRDTPVAGHLLTVNAANGAVSFERYRTVQLAP